MTRKIIFGIIAIIGPMAAICVTDNSEHEITIRFIGTALFFIGALLGGWMNNNKSHTNGTAAK